MSNIPRKSEFFLTDHEKDILRKLNDKALRDYIEKARDGKIEMTEEKASKLLLINLFYDIGMQDYWIYREVNNNPPKTRLDDWIQERLISRAFDSARLQVLIEDMKYKGYDIDKILNPQLGKVFKYKAHNDSSLDMLYHGTSEEIDPNQIGMPDENGIYYIRDGISYWTTDYDEAKKYSNHINREQRERGLMGGNVYSRSIEDGTLCTTIAETHGGAFAMWQGELITLNHMGVKYIFSSEKGRSDVLDISNFADFVKKRDECLVKVLKEHNFRLPEKEESLSHYYYSIKQSRNKGQTKLEQWEQE